MAELSLLESIGQMDEKMKQKQDQMLKKVLIDNWFTTRATIINLYPNYVTFGKEDKMNNQFTLVTNGVKIEVVERKKCILILEELVNTFNCKDLNKNGKRIRIVGVLIHLIKMHLLELDINVLNFLTYTLNGIRDKIWKELQKMNESTWRDDPKNMNDVDYDKLRNYGIEKDEIDVFKDLRLMFCKLLQKIKEALFKDADFKENGNIFKKVEDYERVLNGEVLLANVNEIFAGYNGAISQRLKALAQPSDEDDIEILKRKKNKEMDIDSNGKDLEKEKVDMDDIKAMLGKFGEEIKKLKELNGEK